MQENNEKSLTVENSSNGAGHKLLFLFKINDFMGTGLTDCIPHKTLLTGFKEIFAPAVVQVLRNALSTA